MDRIISWRREGSTLRATFPTGIGVAIFRPGITNGDYRLRFYDRLGEPTGDVHSFRRQGDAKDFARECFIEGLI